MSLEPTAPRPAPAFTADQERPITGRPFLVPLYVPHFTARSPRGWVNKPLCGSSAHRFQAVNVVVRWSGVTDLLTDTCFKLGFASGKLAEVLTPGCGRSRARAYEHRHHEQGHRTYQDDASHSRYLLLRSGYASSARSIGSSLKNYNRFEFLRKLV